tara:strand:- start:52909 stop:53766 length:858 start_codon:yes stop_codon:yes gene_type:complete
MLNKEHKVYQISSDAIFAIPTMKPLKVLISILISFFLILLDINYSILDKSRGYTQDILSPLHEFITLPVSAVDTFKKSFVLNKELKEQVQTLKEENLKLEVINNFLSQISEENKMLTELWLTTKENPGNYLIAPKRNIASNEFNPILTLDLPIKNRKVDLNNPVISVNGLAGRVSALGIKSAEVILIQDVRSFVPVIGSKSRLKAIMQGAGINRKGTIINIKKNTKFILNEDIYTSGAGGVFPRGLYVGKIVSKIDDSSSDFIKLKIAFKEDPFSTDYYLIFNND